MARHWPDVLSNALEPGWVPTKMGGPDAPDDMSLAPVTQAWLATSDDPTAMVTGRYFYHQRPRETHPSASSLEVQEGLLDACGDRCRTSVVRERSMCLDAGVRANNQWVTPSL